jgi:uncharacterized protein Yka (UPF0111/DUF47 family)
MKKTGMIDRLFPAKYDFYKMLETQARLNSGAVGALAAWLTSGSEVDARRLGENAEKAEAVRKDMEKKLVEAFSTPFDRGDLYYISVTMHRCLEYARSTLVSMRDFDVAPDDVIRKMAVKLQFGTETFASSVGVLKSAPEKAEQLIPPIRTAHMDTEQLYRNGMCAVFDSGDAMDALRHREIYHHLKDASKYLDDAVDILHRIIVRLT